MNRTAGHHPASFLGPAVGCFRLRVSVPDSREVDSKSGCGRPTKKLGPKIVGEIFALKKLQNLVEIQQFLAPGGPILH